jgi:predicted dehydrogenase
MTQRIKPDIYPRVEDEATIVVTYPRAQAIIQASWNWPFDRKDMEIYGQTGSVVIPRKDILQVRTAKSPLSENIPPPLKSPYTDPLSYLAAVTRGDIQPSGLSSLEINLIATEILDAARKSAETGQRIDLAQKR